MIRVATSSGASSGTLRTSEASAASIYLTIEDWQFRMPDCISLALFIELSRPCRCWVHVLGFNNSAGDESDEERWFMLDRCANADFEGFAAEGAQAVSC